MELLVIIIVLALLFDYINGFHDAANSIATIVSTRVLTPFQAVLWAAAFNFVAFFIAKYVIGGFGIANTVSKTVIEDYITLPIILSGVVAAIIWNLFTWWKGIPSSSSHTLIGGFAGAAIMASGFGQDIRQLFQQNEKTRLFRNKPIKKRILHNITYLNYYPSFSVAPATPLSPQAIWKSQ